MALTLSDALKAAKNRLHGDEAILWLVDIQRTASTNLRLAGWTTDVTYAGVTFTRTVLEVQDMSEEPGALSEVSIGIPNILGVTQTQLEDGELLNRRATLYMLPESRIGQADGALSSAYYVMHAVATTKAIALTLGVWALGEIVAPQDRFIRTRCRWVFKSTECGYAGAETTCDKSFVGSTGCSGRSNQARYGGFPFLLSGPEGLHGFGV